MEEEKRENRFEKEQPLRHPMASVARKEDTLKINNQVYQILIDKDQALDIELLRKKYDPYLDQYDFLVGDISSTHLRLKGFYKDIAKTAIDKKQKAIADYLIEYCNPGSAYFVLKLVSPVHHYSRYEKNRHYRSKNVRRRTNFKNNFKKRKVKKTKFPHKKTISIKKKHGHNAFVIKKRGRTKI